MPQLSIDRLRSLDPPAPSFRWECIFPVLPVVTDSSTALNTFSSYTAGLNSILQGGLQNLLTNSLSSVFPGAFNAPMKVVVEAIDFENWNIDSIGRHNGYTELHYPGFNKLSSLNIKFYETENYDVIKYLRSWQRLIIDKNGNYGYPASFKQNIQLFCYNWTTTDTPTLTGTLTGCWPIQVTPIPLNYQESNRITTSCTFSVDDSVIQGI